MNQTELQYFESVGYSFVREIAQGGYGVVYEMYSEKFKSSYALKKIPQNTFKQCELDCLMSIDDPFIVRLYQIFKLEDFIYMVFEYCPNDLNKLFMNSRNMTDDEVRKYAYDVCLAIKSIHKRNIAHNDIKPANFFIDNYGRVKIGDFGLSTLHSCVTSCKHAKGTRLYMAPEIYVLKEYDPMKADIWSLGVTLYFFATKTVPFNAPDLNKLQQVVNIGLFPKDKVRDKLLLNVICECFEKNPAKRPTIDEILKNPYFAPLQKNEQNQMQSGAQKLTSKNHSKMIGLKDKKCSFLALAGSIQCFKGSKIRLISSQTEIKNHDGSSLLL